MESPLLATFTGVCHRYDNRPVLGPLDLTLPAGQMIGVIGPDGVGKSTLLALLAGARRLQQGQLQLLWADMAERADRERLCPRIAYMPQGLGKNLYPSLSVTENLQFFARLFGHSASETARRIQYLTQATGLAPFVDRPAAQLSGGMKQKLSLCCALIHDPLLLILDEPTTGVDPLARSQFWRLIADIRAQQPQLSVLVATAYMDEAAAFDQLILLHNGVVLAQDSPQALLARTGATELEHAYVALLPASARLETVSFDASRVAVPSDAPLAIEARALTMQFGDFVAVDAVSFAIRRGEIFGFLGSNGCGKSTTMKMLTGLLTASAGEALLFGQPLAGNDMALRRRVGYMSQAFSLYSELTVQQNLVLHARLYGVAAADIDARVLAMSERFGLLDVQQQLPNALPLGVRQRLSLAVAMVHQPELLILDEPTSGVDPQARDQFWQHMLTLARDDQVTIFISTHFMNEAMRCDRISLMHAGRVLVSDSPAQIAAGYPSLEQAFIHWLQQAGADASAPTSVTRSEGIGAALTEPAARNDVRQGTSQGLGQRLDQGVSDPVRDAARDSAAVGARHRTHRRAFHWRRMLAVAQRESTELVRDPLRAVMALFGCLLLLLVMGYGITMDVEQLKVAVLDQDQSQRSQDYIQQLQGSRYFSMHSPAHNEAQLQQWMQQGDIALALQIPPDFGRRMDAGKPVQIGGWLDGSMPKRAETMRGYAQGLHQHWLAQWQGSAAARLLVETRYRYNPDVRSLIAMVPAVIPLLLLMIPAVLTALSVVREKELGSMLNLYVTPVTRTEFLLGKQLPYIVIAELSFILMLLTAVVVFAVPITGSLLFYLGCGLLFSAFSTGFGLLASAFTRSQIAAIVVAVLGTMLPAVQFAGMIDPVSSLEGVSRVLGELHPASHFLTISRGVFSKGLGYDALAVDFWALVASVPVVAALAIMLLPKQEH